MQETEDLMKMVNRMGIQKILSYRKGCLGVEKITKKLFHGEIHAFETTVPQSKEYWDIQNRMGEIEEYFRSKFTGEDEKYAEEWNNLRLSKGEIHDFALFDYGFCLGAQLMCGVFMGIDENQRDSENYVNPDR